MALVEAGLTIRVEDLDPYQRQAWLLLRDAKADAEANRQHNRQQVGS